MLRPLSELGLWWAYRYRRVAARRRAADGKVTESPIRFHCRITLPWDAFRVGCSFSWVEGQNIVIDYRLAEFKLDRLPSSRVSWSGSKPMCRNFRRPATRREGSHGDDSIVMVGVGPCRAGSSRASRPGGNVTGLAFSVGTEVFTGT
jgi:hypothetical protein